MIFDVAIIGGGPAGYTAAEKASASGLKTVIFEKNAIGGVCLNEGCIPTKTLLYSAKTLDNIKLASKYGISADSSCSLNLDKVIARKNKIVRKLTAGIKQKLNIHNVEIVNECVSALEDNKGFISITHENGTVNAKNILICTGSEPIIPPIKGINDIEYWTSKEALDNKEIPQNIAIIGGGVIGIEFASFFNSLGSKVSVIEMTPEILGSMDKELSAILRSEYQKKGVEFYTKTKVIEVASTGLVLEKDGETFSIVSDKILISAGRKPNISTLNIDNLNIEMFKNGIKVDENMRTSHPSVYACGDVTGFSLLAHTAIREAEVAINHILDKKDSMSYKAIPAVVYTNPEVAGVGETEESLSTKNIPHDVVKLPMSYSGRFVAENELSNGVCKFIIDKNRQILGCHILGNPASELIVIAGIAIEKNYTVEDFQRIVFPHPTVGEIIHETLFTDPKDKE
ncbi:dihydrolipoyl dehydrogenase [Dysgonomonas sp. 216]|uniref:dihydrolipoyl dehydrogenase n=1 Tax=Dysgonomonas sp. 216 TaxID=2302934 RepID=UPI0013D5019F|nr:dihydrolipoyl dehydrogenase [Dysgonomonas sp. 216]NDW18249.1 dihydrolipoyl dehydrogenase [Dysgonomonas sp. 216]